MKTCSACLLYLLTRAAVVFPEVLLVRRAEGQSTDFSCPRGGPAVTLTGLQLSRLGPGGPGLWTQHALLSAGEGFGPGPGPGPDRRVAVASGGLGAGWVNLTLSGLRPGDSGLYTLELSSSSPGAALTCPQVLLMVEGTESGCERCCQKYASLIYSIFTATALLLLLGAGHLARRRWTAGPGQRGLKRPLPIYEEMDSKRWRRGWGVTGRPPEDDAPPGGPPRPEETPFPVYANAGLRHLAEDNYYACPRGVPQHLGVV